MRDLLDYLQEFVMRLITRTPHLTPYKVVGNREWNCGAHFAEEGMPFSESAVQRIAFQQG